MLYTLVPIHACVCLYVCVSAQAALAILSNVTCVCVCVFASVSEASPASQENKTKQNRAEKICAIIPRQAAALCLCAPLPVGPHIITAATLIHHSIVAVLAGPILSLAQQRYIKKQ